MVTPFAPGGNTDILGRYLAPRLHERFGQYFIVENRPGAGGMIGNNAVAKSTPDGHTLLIGSGAFTSVAATARKLPYDALQDFAWVSLVTVYPFVVVVKPDSPVRSVGDLIAAAKRSPGKLNYGSVGVGSVFHLAAELFNAMAAAETTHVPFKGGAEPLTELIAGRIDVIFSTLSGAMGYVQGNRVRPIAVTGAERAPQLPDVPPLAQTLPGYEVTSFAGIAAPRATPRAVIDRLNRELRAVLEQPEVRRQLTEQGGTVRPTTPAEAQRHVADEIAKWRRVVAERKLAID